MDKYKIAMWVMVVIIAIMGGYIIYLNHKANKTMESIQTIESNDKLYTQFYYERKFESLKNENKVLYDSLKNQKDVIESLSRYKYHIVYSTDTIYTEKIKEVPAEVMDLPNETYVYTSESDTISYELQVNSKTEPNWYKLKTEINDEFTIVNKRYADGTLSTTIGSENKGDIYDITNWQKPQKKKWYQNFSLGPTVSVGYDPINNNVGVVVGIGVTYNILSK